MKIKLVIIIAIILILAGGSLILQYLPSGPKNGETSPVSGTRDLLLTEQELQQLGMVSEINDTVLQQLGITGGTNCWTDNEYSNIVDSSSGQYSICAYLIPGLNNTSVIIQLQKFENYDALNGSYQYDSSHYYSAEGLISENEYGDQSRFRVNNENDYGGQYNEPGVYYYHLWITKDLYLIHVTSGGRSQEADDYVVNIGQAILSKFE